MNKQKGIEIQNKANSYINEESMYSIDREIITSPTKGLFHQSARFLLIKKGTAKMRIPKTHPRMSPNKVSLFCFFILVVHLPAVKELLKRECDDRNYRKHDNVSCCRQTEEACCVLFVNNGCKYVCCKSRTTLCHSPDQIKAAKSADQGKCDNGIC